MKREKQNPLVTYKVNKAVEILKEEIQSIPDVQTWASEAGVSTRWLCKAMKNEHGNSPKILLRKKRYKVLFNNLKEDPELSGYCLAREIGLSDEKSLYKFLSNHYDTTLTQLRDDIIKASLEE